MDFASSLPPHKHRRSPTPQNSHSSPHAGTTAKRGRTDLTIEICHDYYHNSCCRSEIDLSLHHGNETLEEEIEAPQSLDGSAPPPSLRLRSSPVAGDESLILNWLIGAFGSSSLDQIVSAYTEAGGDPKRAARILGAELVDPDEGGGTRKERDRRPKREPAVVSALFQMRRSI